MASHVPFERIIRLHLINLNSCVHNEDFAYVHTSRAHLLHSGRLNADPGQQVRRDTQSIIEACVQKIMDAKDIVASPERWIENGSNLLLIARYAVESAIRTASLEAIEAFRQVPTIARESATNLFLYALDLVGDLIAVLMMLSTKLMAKRDEILSGDWDIDQYFNISINHAILECECHIE
jgi:hypothetical protein